jgi:plastocyanin
MSNTMIVIIALVVIVGGYLLVKSMAPAPSSVATSPTTVNIQSPTTSPADTTLPTTSDTPSLTTTPALSPSTGQTMTINYSSTGFSPASTTIKAGTTVVWKNNDTDPMQIDSNPHPTHTSYPPMNASTPTQPGDTYTFTFTDPGTYGYHNHLNPANKGTIIVQ